MHVKMRLISVFLVMLMLGSVVVGGQGILRTEDQVEAEAWTSRKETIYVWYSDASLENYLNSAAVSFGNAEGVRVIPVYKNSSKLLEDVYESTMDPEKQTPDAYLINNDELEQAYLSGLATEIQNPSGLVNEAWYSLTALSASTYKLKLVAYPFYYDTSILVYNKDYLDMWVRQQADRAALGEQGLDEQDMSEAAEWSENCIDDNGIPKTVEGLLKFADTFDAPEGVDGIMKWDVTDIFYNYWIVGDCLTIGGDCGDDKTNLNIFNDDTVESLKVYQDLNQFFFIESNNIDKESVLQDFLEGRMVFTIGTTEFLQRLEEAKANGTFTYEYGFAKLPDVNEHIKSRALSVTEVIAINGFSDHKDLANRFAEYATRAYSPELYPRSGKMATALEASRGEKILSVFAEQYENSISLPKMMEIGNLWLQLEALFSKVWDGEEVFPLVKALEEQISTQIMIEE